MAIHIGAAAAAKFVTTSVAGSVVGDQGAKLLGLKGSEPKAETEGQPPAEGGTLSKLLEQLPGVKLAKDALPGG